MLINGMLKTNDDLRFHLRRGHLICKNLALGIVSDGFVGLPDFI